MDKKTWYLNAFVFLRSLIRQKKMCLECIFTLSPAPVTSLHFWMQSKNIKPEKKI